MRASWLPGTRTVLGHASSDTSAAAAGTGREALVGEVAATTTKVGADRVDLLDRGAEQPLAVAAAADMKVGDLRDQHAAQCYGSIRIAQAGAIQGLDLQRRADDDGRDPRLDLAQVKAFDRDHAGPQQRLVGLDTADRGVIDADQADFRPSTRRAAASGLIEA